MHPLLLPLADKYRVTAGADIISQRRVVGTTWAQITHPETRRQLCLVGPDDTALHQALSDQKSRYLLVTDKTTLADIIGALET